MFYLSLAISCLFIFIMGIMLGGLIFLFFHMIINYGIESFSEDIDLVLYGGKYSDSTVFINAFALLMLGAYNWFKTGSFTAGIIVFSICMIGSFIVDIFIINNSVEFTVQ